jgi:hypothetical protein
MNVSPAAPGGGFYSSTNTLTFAIAPTFPKFEIRMSKFFSEFFWKNWFFLCFLVFFIDFSMFFVVFLVFFVGNLRLFVV